MEASRAVVVLLGKVRVDERGSVLVDDVERLCCAASGAFPTANAPPRGLIVGDVQDARDDVLGAGDGEVAHMRLSAVVVFCNAESQQRRDVSCRASECSEREDESTCRTNRQK